MNREALINILKMQIEEEPIYEIDKKFISSNYADKKNGIYLLYDDNSIVRYVGKCGNGQYTSFYHRIYTHGSGAHCKKDWFKNIKKFRFKVFPDLDSQLLNKVERLMIYAYGQPAYKDCCITAEDYETIASKRYVYNDIRQ